MILKHIICNSTRPKRTQRAAVRHHTDLLPWFVPFLFGFQYTHTHTPPSFVLYIKKCVLELNVSCFCWWLRQQLGQVRSGSTRGIFSWSQNSKSGQKMQPRIVQCHFLTTAWNMFPSFMWLFFFFVWASRRFYPVLNIACCAPLEELLCVWTWRWWCCWGGAELVAEGHGWERRLF